MSKKMRAAVLVEYDNIEMRSVEMPILSDDEVLVRVGYVGICGSDQHIFHGDFHPRTPVPFIMGHEFAGTICAVGKNIKKWQVNDRVAVDPLMTCGECPACKMGHLPACQNLKLKGIDMDGGFAEYVTAEEFMLFRLPNDISDRDAALVEIFSIGFHANKRGGTQPGDSLAIWGAGRVGHVIMQAARTITDAPIYIVDVLQNRLDIAEKAMPNVFPVNARECDPVERIMQLTDGRGVDIAFEAVGHEHQIKGVPHPVRCCIQVIRGAGTVCALGLADDPAPLVMKELIWKEARLVTSRNTHGEFADSIAAMAAGKLNTDALVSAEFQLKDLQRAFDTLDSKPEAFLKILVKI